jgi:hypothetical protein
MSSSRWTSTAQAGRHSTWNMPSRRLREQASAFVKTCGNGGDGEGGDMGGDKGQQQIRERVWIEKFDHTEDVPVLVETQFVERHLNLRTTEADEPIQKSESS